mgnify:CR=1 FL=1
MNNKGQALVEFVLILPILIMILFVIVDFGMIFNTKSDLENKSSDIILQLNNNQTLEQIKNNYDELEIETEVIGDNLKIVFKDYVNIITPGLNRIIEDPYPVSVERIIPNVTS